MKLYVMSINGKNQYFKSEFDRNHAFNILSLHDTATALKAKLFEIELH